MADWGNIAIGAVQGANQGLRTIAEVQKIKLLKDQEDRQNNLYNLQMKKMQEDEQPIYLDRLKTPDNQNSYEVLRKRAETAGILYTDATGREYTKRGMGKEFLSLQKTDEEIIGAKLKDYATTEQMLKDQLANTNKPDEAAALKQKLDTVSKERDTLSYQSTAFVNKKKLETADLTAQAALVKAMKESPDKWQSSSVTEKGGFPIWKDPTTQKTMVVKPDGVREVYDPKIHGKELSQNVSQTTIYNQGQGATGAFKPGTLDYMVQKYETDGVIPPFGMGAVGAKQRAAFFDKAAARAAERGDTGAAQAIRGMEFKSNQSAMTDLTKREQLINSYNVRIHETTDKVLVPLIKKWDLQNPRFVNWPVNKLAEIMGSGDLASLKLALNSVSVEVGKVEFNALGIQQLTDQASKFMNSVHDPNMKVGELLKVLDTSKALGTTGINAISNQRKELINRTGKIAPEGTVNSSPGGAVLPKGMKAGW